MKSQQSPIEKLSFYDGAAFSLMVGLGETFVPAFVLAIGLGDAASGLISTVPLLVGSALQLSSSYFVKLLRSYRRWVVLCACLQAVSFLPLILTAGFHLHSLSLPLLACSLYWGAGMSAGPAWNAWMDRMVPAANRIRFWGRRTHLSQSGALVGFLAGGYLLSVITHEMTGFLLLFLFSFLFRAISAFFLSRHPEPVFDEKSMPTTPWAGLRYIFRGKGGEYVRFMFFFNFSVYIASPFFTAYMLTQLKMGYFEYVFLISTSLAGKVFTMPLLTKWVAKNGNKRLIWFSSVGIAILPALWLVSGHWLFLFFLQLLSGLTWAGLELSFPLFILDHCPNRERISVLSIYNMGRAGFITLGSLIGAVLLEDFGSGIAAYGIIFWVSTGLRFVSIVVLTKPNVPTSKRRHFFWRTTGIRPSEGAMTPPVLGEGEHREALSGK